MDFIPLGQIRTLSVSEPKKRAGQCTLLSSATELVSALQAKEVI